MKNKNPITIVPKNQLVANATQDKARRVLDLIRPVGHHDMVCPSPGKMNRRVWFAQTETLRPGLRRKEGDE